MPEKRRSKVSYEDADDAEIEGYDLEVTGGGEVNVVAKDTAETTVTNTYTLQTGSLKITKALGANAPESATSKTYTFTVTGPNNYSKTVTIEGAGEEKIEGLVRLSVPMLLNLQRRSPTHS